MPHDSALASSYHEIEQEGAFPETTMKKKPTATQQYQQQMDAAEVSFHSMSLQEQIRRQSSTEIQQLHNFDEDLIIRRAQAAIDIEVEGLRQIHRSLGIYSHASSTGQLPMYSSSTNPPIRRGRDNKSPSKIPTHLPTRTKSPTSSTSASSCSSDEDQDSEPDEAFRTSEGELIRVHAEDRMQLAVTDHGKAFIHAVKMCHSCKGRVVVVGMGKSGHVGRKIAATLASTGTPSFFLHAAEASHGDLGMITEVDVVLAISNSGETPELTVILPVIKRVGAQLIAMTGKEASTLAKAANCILFSFVNVEACPLNISPTASSTAQMALGDALAVVLLQEKGFTAKDFALRHPGGALGRKLLTTVGDVMRKVPENIPIILPSCTLFEAMIKMTELSSNTALVNCSGDKSLLLRPPSMPPAPAEHSDPGVLIISRPSSMVPKTPLSQNEKNAIALPRPLNATPNSIGVSSSHSGRSSSKKDASRAAAAALSAKVWNMATPTTNALDHCTLRTASTGSYGNGRQDSFALPPSAATQMLVVEGKQNTVTDGEVASVQQTASTYGVLTNGDLQAAIARLQSSSNGVNIGALLVRDVMARNPKSIRIGSLAADAGDIILANQCDNESVDCRHTLLVIDNVTSQVVGIVAIADLVAAKLV